MQETKNDFFCIIQNMICSFCLSFLSVAFCVPTCDSFEYFLHSPDASPYHLLKVIALLSLWRGVGGEAAGTGRDSP